jgi:hypothetical protein
VVAWRISDAWVVKGVRPLLIEHWRDYSRFSWRLSSRDWASRERNVTVIKCSCHGPGLFYLRFGGNSSAIPGVPERIRIDLSSEEPESMLKRERVERRSSDRAAVVCPVTLIFGGQLHYAHTSNLSENGLFLNDCPPLEPGLLINLVLTLPNEHPVSTSGEVCFVQPGIGAGIKFLKLKPSDRALIGQLIRSRYDDARRSSRTRRREPRSKIAIALTLYRPSLKNKQSPLHVTTEDISRRGACLTTPAALEIGEVVTLTCVPEECEIRAVVRYTHHNDKGWRTGVEFLSFPKKWLIMELAVSALLEGQRLG